MPKGKVTELSRLDRTLDLIEIKVDAILGLQKQYSGQAIPWPIIPSAAFLGAGILGENRSIAKCTPWEIPIADSERALCFRVGVVTTDRNTTVDVTFTDRGGGDPEHSETDLTAGQQTSCRGPLKKIKIHAKGGDAIVTVVTCKCP